MVHAATSDGSVLIMPAAASAAPLIVADPADQQRQRAATLRLTSLAGLAGAPVVVAPLLRADDLPFGVEFVGSPGSDRRLLAWVANAIAASID
jgi:amidase